MSKGVICFNDLTTSFDLITTNAQLSSVLVFIPYSDKDIIRLVENDVSFNVLKNTEAFEGKYLSVEISLSDIKYVIFENN